MELAATAFSALMAAAPEVAAVGAEAAAGAGGWVTTMAEGASTLASSGSGALSSLQGGMSIASSISQFLGGGFNFLSGMNNARMNDINARSEELQSEAKALDIQKTLLKQIGESRVAFAAGGLDVGSGAQIEQSLRGEADWQTRLARESGDMAATSRRMQSDSMRLGAYGSLAASIGKGAKEFGSTNLDISKRG